jgi:hypothetical protein
MAPPADTPITQIVGDSKAEADAVFVGKVVSIQNAEGADQMKPSYITLKVIRSWKGVETKQIKIVTVANGGMCGVNFVVGKDFIIYAHQGAETSTLGASLCSRTQMIRTKSDDEKYLGKHLKLKTK